MKKLKTLLVMAQPESGVIDEIGIQFIAAVIEQSGHEVIVMQNDENDIDYLEIEDFKPDIVGFCMYYNNVDIIRNISSRLKEMFKDIVIVAGGALATNDNRRVMQYEAYIDYIIRGEGEATWLELIEVIESNGDISKVKGITYRGKKRIIDNLDREPIKDLDMLPFPKRNLTGDNTYVYMSTSRGCVRNCSFCNSHDYWKQWRGMSPKRVVDEMEYLVNNGVNYIMLIDNSFEDSDGKCTRGLAIANEIIKRGLKIPYQVNFRAEFWKVITPEMIDTLKKSGLIAVSVGIETANENDRILYNKYATLEDNIKIVEVLRGYDIHVNTNFIMFNPYSTFEGLSQNIEYLKRLNEVCWGNISNSYKILEGTALSERIKVDGLSVYTPAYNDIYAYKYKDPRMIPLVDYFYNINHEWLAKHNDYIIGYWSALKLIDKKYEVFGDKGIRDIVKGYEVKVKELCDTIGYYIAEWFQNLLDIAENGWDTKKAMDMENEVMNSYGVLYTFNELEVVSAAIYKHLKEIGLV